MFKRRLFIHFLFFLGVNVYGQMDSIPIVKKEVKSFLQCARQSYFENFIPDSNDIGFLVFENDSIGKVFFRAFYLRKPLIPHFKEFFKEKTLFAIDSIGGTPFFYISQKGQCFYNPDGINVLKELKQRLPEEFKRYEEAKSSEFYITPGLNLLVIGKYINDNRVLFFRGLSSPPFVLP